MKKIVKPFVIGASVLAIAGVGAVSLAKWGNGTTTDTVANNKTDKIDAITLTTGGTYNAAVTGLKPWDQNMSTAGDVESGKTIEKGTQTVNVVTGAGYTKSDAKLTITMSNIQSGAHISNITTDSQLWVSTSATAFDSGKPASETAGTTMIVNDSDGATLKISVDEDVTIYYFLVSNNLDDMDKTFTLNLSAAVGETPKA